MKRLVFVILLLSTIDSYGQLHALNVNDQYDIPWDQIEVSQNDSIIRALCELNSQLKYNYENFPELFHLINLNNDLKPDLLFYWPDNSNEPILEIYLNDTDKLIPVLNKRGTITQIDFHKLKGQILISLNEIGYSSYPFLNRYHIIDINAFKKESYLNSQTFFYFGGTDIPDKLPLFRPFEVVQLKYRLRLTPAIKNDNIICELAEGDRGTALAQKTDSTGRIWYFALVDNNIYKSVNDYYYIDSDSPDGLNKKIFGWISSKYLKEIE